MLQQYPMDTFVGFQNRQIGYMIDGVFYPTMHPQYEGHHLLQRKKSKPLTIRDPNDCNRDVMAEIFGERLPSPPIPPSVWPQCSNVVEAPVPPDTTPPNEVELSTGPASETCQPRLKLLKRPGLLLFSFPPEEAVQQKKTEKVKRRRRKEQSQTETRSQTNPREVVTFCIPLMEEEKMEVKEAKIGFGDFLSEHLTPTQHPGGDIVEAPALLKTTPPNEVELSTGPASDLFKRPVLPHFSIPPEEVVQQKYNRWGIKKQNQIGMHKTQSHTRLREPFSICVPQTEEEEKGTEKAVGDRLLCDEQKTKQESRDDHVHPSAPVKPAWTPQRSYRQRPRKLTLGDLLSFSLACTSTKRTIIKANTSPENTPSNETLPRKRSKKRIRFCHMPTTEEKQKEEMNKDEQSLNQRSARSE